MLPILELRVGLGVASAFGIPYPLALLICCLGNMVPIPIISFFVRKALSFLQQHGPLKKFAAWVERHGTKKGEEFEKKYPTRVFWGLMIFVAIPLPGTGAWTGALIAALMGVNPKRSIPALCLGVLGCAGIMSFIWYGIPALIRFFG
ncbi:MAG: COG2426 family protein [Oscillospiraceae bacterium]